MLFLIFFYPFNATSTECDNETVVKLDVMFSCIFGRKVFLFGYFTC